MQGVKGYCYIQYIIWGKSEVLVISTAILPTKFPFTVQVHLPWYNILNAHTLLQSGLVAQSVDQEWSNSKLLGSFSTLLPN